MLLNVLLAVAVLVLIGLLVARFGLGVGRDPESLPPPHGERRATLAREVERLAAEHGLGPHVVAADGSVALGLQRATGRLVVVRAGSGGDEAGTLRARTIERGGVIGVELREHLGFKDEKGGLTPRVRALDLHVFFADVERPVVVVPFVDLPQRPGTGRFVEVRAEAQHWEGVLRALAHGARGATSTESPRPPEATPDDRRDAARQRAVELLQRARSSGGAGSSGST